MNTEGHLPRPRTRSRVHKSHEAHQNRRRQNRQAQQVYRERKRAAEELQRRRTARLESAVEEMSAVLMDLADDFIAVDEMRQNHALMASLQKAMRKSLALTNEVLESDGVKDIDESRHDVETRDDELANSNMEWNASPQATSSKGAWQCQHEAGSPHYPVFEISHQPASTAMALTRPFTLAAAFNRQSIPRPQQRPFGNGWMSCHGDFVDHHPPSTGSDSITPDTFPFRLVEQSLANSFNVLLRDVGLTTKEVRSIFRWSLNTKTREGLLCHMRWMLGPGRFILPSAANIPAERCMRALSSGRNIYGEEDDAPPVRRNEFGDEDLPAGPLRLLSARDIEEKLDHLKTRPIGDNMLEMTIPSPTQMTNSQHEGDGGCEFPASNVQQGLTFLTLRLSLSLLMHRLSTAAICLHAGPGYPEADLGRFIQESMVQPADTPVAVV